MSLLLIIVKKKKKNTPHNLVMSSNRGQTKAYQTEPDILFQRQHPEQCSAPKTGVNDEELMPMFTQQLNPA